MGDDVCVVTEFSEEVGGVEVIKSDRGSGMTVNCMVLEGVVDELIMGGNGHQSMESVGTVMLDDGDGRVIAT